MAAYTPPPSPGDLRSPRKRALEIGTMPSGFSMGEVPDLTMPRATPTPAMPQISYEGGAINPSAPFTTKK